MNIKCHLVGHDLQQTDKNSGWYECSRGCSGCGTRKPNNKWILTFWDSSEYIEIKVVLVALVGLALAIYLIAMVKLAQCNAYSDMGIETLWNFWTACMGNHPKFGWIPIDEYFRILNLSIQ